MTTDNTGNNKLTTNNNPSINVKDKYYLPVSNYDNPIDQALARVRTGWIIRYNPDMQNKYAVMNKDMGIVYLCDKSEYALAYYRHVTAPKGSINNYKPNDGLLFDNMAFND